LGQETLWNVYDKHKTIPKNLVVIGPGRIRYTTGEEEHNGIEDISGILLYPDPKYGGHMKEPLLVESELKQYVVIGMLETE